MRPLVEVSQDPNFEGVFFRRTTPALIKPGSLWPEAKKLYSPFKINVRQKPYEIDFSPQGGGRLAFDHLEHEKSAEDNHQGTQYSFVGFDEL